MMRHQASGVRRQKNGFTLIELLVVMAIIAILVSIAAPRYFNSVQKSKEAVLKQDLSTMRDAIDKYYSDNDKYPSELDDLVTKKYLRKIPIDPITDNASTWVVVPPSNPDQGGVFDLRSGAPGNGRDGTPYSEW